MTTVEVVLARGRSSRLGQQNESEIESSTLPTRVKNGLAASSREVAQAAPGHRLTLSATPGATVGAAMITNVKTLAFDATVEDVYDFFKDDHVHIAVVIRGQQVLTAIQRSDFEAEPSLRQLARDLGTLDNRTVGEHDSLNATHLKMIRKAQRRVVVVGLGGDLRGLLCLKRHGRGFCSDGDVEARQFDNVGCD